ncbi:MAG: hypothetical protein IPK33_00770 [Gemmatimonadetes bacterium]|nr:hypothetical protein [Gemmatimonadota bacterium]
MRTLIAELLVDVDETAARIDVIVRWAGGVHSTLAVRKNRTGEHRKATSRDVVALVRDLVRVLPDGRIAAVLNRLGYRTGHGNTWTGSRVVTLRYTHDLPVFDATRAARDGDLTLEGAAALLGVSATTVRTLITRRFLPRRRSWRWPRGSFGRRISPTTPCNSTSAPCTRGARSRRRQIPRSYLSHHQRHSEVT